MLRGPGAGRVLRRRRRGEEQHYNDRMPPGDTLNWTDTARARVLLEEIGRAFPRLITLPPHDVQRSLLWLVLHYIHPADRGGMLADVLAELETDGE